MNYKAIFMILILVVSISAVAFAYRPVKDYDNDNNDKPKKFELKFWKQIDDHEFDLGTVNYNGEQVQGIAFVYKNEEFSHLGRGSAGTSACYKFTNGKKWRTKENWIVNPANSEGLSSTFLLTNIATDIQKWETAAGKDIFGTGALTTLPLLADSTYPDGKNEVYFADVVNTNAIAVTIIWFNSRGIIEWDQVYDDVDFQWSSTGAADKMDFENIATHEIGHAFGMGHPANACSQETMYYSAAYGETKKRSLNTGDKTGIKRLYA